MGKRRYRNFDLLLEDEGDGQYQARVIASPLNNHPQVQFEFPFDEKTLKILLLTLDPGRSGTRNVVDADMQQAAMDFGGPLFDAIFTGPLALDWNSSLVQANAEKARGLRLRLFLGDAPALAGLPWELLYDAKASAFPAQSERTPLVRFLDVANRIEPVQVNGPLRVLAIISSPTDLDELQVEREWGRIRKALEVKVREGLVVVERLPEATVDALGEWLLDHETHVIHFVGHGDFDPRIGQGFIYFQDERGFKDPVSASVLGPFIHDHDALRLVVVNACRSARMSATAPYGGMAQGLMQKGATAVVAMQFPITDQAAVMFTGKFYGALAVGLPVDQAVTYARKALLARYRGEWATPVLFMRSPDGNIFKHVQAPAGWVVEETPEPILSEPILSEPILSEPTQSEPTQSEPTQAEPTQAEPTLSDSVLNDPALTELTVADLDVSDLEVFEDADDIDDEGSGAGRWIRTHARTFAVASVALVVLIAAVVVTVQLLSGPSLPAKEKLSATQMLVAAADDTDLYDIYLVDTADDSFERPLTESAAAEGKRWLPVLSPDGRSMIYVRDYRRASDNVDVRELRTAAASDGSGDRPLFDPVPAECANGADRPAWIPGTDDLVLRCKNSDDVQHLVRVNLDGDLVEDYFTLGVRAPQRLQWVGYPTVSRDGSYVVFVGSQIEQAEDVDQDEGGGMSLYRMDLASGDVDPLRVPGGAFDPSDSAFSQETNQLAWRAWDVTAETPNFEVYVASFHEDSGTLDPPVNISNDEGASDQDPMFSPDGTQLAYTHQDNGTGVQELWLATVEEPGDRERVSPGHYAFYAVPAWSLR